MTDKAATDDPFGVKAYYEAVVGEPWSELEKSVRSNPRNRWMFQIIDDAEMSKELEAERLASLPWWRKIWRGQ
jgi:hypothetical protein